MNHLKEVEVLNDELLKGSKSENKEYFVNSKIFVTLLALVEGKSGKPNGNNLNYTEILAAFDNHC